MKKLLIIIGTVYAAIVGCGEELKPYSQMNAEEQRIRLTEVCEVAQADWYTNIVMNEVRKKAGSDAEFGADGGITIMNVSKREIMFPGNVSIGGTERPFAVYLTVNDDDKTVTVGNVDVAGVE